MRFDNRYVTYLRGGKLVFDGTATPSSTPDYSEVCALEHGSTLLLDHRIRVCVSESYLRQASSTFPPHLQLFNRVE